MLLNNMLQGYEKINIALKHLELINPDIIKPLYSVLDDINNCKDKDKFAELTTSLINPIEEAFCDRDGGTSELVKDYIKTVEDFSEFKYYKLTYKN